MKSKEKTPVKRPAKPFKGAVDGKPFTSTNQPTPEAKSKGWEAKRAEKLLTQKIIEKLTDGETLDEYVQSLITNAKLGNAKAIDTINNGLEEQVTKVEAKVETNFDLKQALNNFMK